jgi:hypothetical protein
MRDHCAVDVQSVLNYRAITAKITSEALRNHRAIAE